MTWLRWLGHYLSMRASGSGHIGAKQYANNMAAARRRAQAEKKGKL